MRFRESTFFCFDGAASAKYTLSVSEDELSEEEKERTMFYLISQFSVAKLKSGYIFVSFKKMVVVSERGLHIFSNNNLSNM